MRILRGYPPSGKSHKIICAGCGKHAVEAGVAVSHETYEEAFGLGAGGVVDEEDLHPLCESCVTALEHGE